MISDDDACSCAKSQSQYAIPNRADTRSESNRDSIGDVILSRDTIISEHVFVSFLATVIGGPQGKVCVESLTIHSLYAGTICNGPPHTAVTVHFRDATVTARVFSF